MKLSNYHFIFLLFASIRSLSTPLLCSTTMITTNKSRSLHATCSANQDGNESSILIQSKCHCGKVLLDISLPKEYNVDVDDDAKVWNCHCHSCRKYHTAAHVSYLQVPKDQVQVVLSNGNPKLIGKYISSCSSYSSSKDGNTDTVMERWYCTECSSKLLSIVSTNTTTNNEIIDSVQEQSNEYLINLGPIDSDTIPQTHTHRWKEQLKQIENNLHSSPIESSSCPCRWNGVLPSNTETTSYSARRRIQLPTAKIWSGGCECGACRYEITLTRLTQLQHCYCNLCRKLSGSPFSTWLPVDKKHFRWKQSNSVTLVRTTPFGQRHICNKCRGIMTIVYDEQPNLIWPCAGGLDDATLPDSSDEMGSLLSRVCHICCRNLPPWIELPEDGTEKLPDAC